MNRFIYTHAVTHKFFKQTSQVCNTTITAVVVKILEDFLASNQKENVTITAAQLEKLYDKFLEYLKPSQYMQNSKRVILSDSDNAKLSKLVERVQKKFILPERLQTRDIKVKPYDFFLFVLFWAIKKYHKGEYNGGPIPPVDLDLPEKKPGKGNYIGKNVPKKIHEDIYKLSQSVGVPATKFILAHALIFQRHAGERLKFTDLFERFEPVIISGAMDTDTKFIQVPATTMAIVDDIYGAELVTRTDNVLPEHSLRIFLSALRHYAAAEIAFDHDDYKNFLKAELKKVV